MMEIMEDPYIYMHGPEHHILVGAALLTAYKNCGGELDFPAALAEMKEREAGTPAAPAASGAAAERPSAPACI